MIKNAELKKRIIRFRREISSNLDNRTISKREAKKLSASIFCNTLLQCIEKWRKQGHSDTEILNWIITACNKLNEENKK